MRNLPAQTDRVKIPFAGCLLVVSIFCGAMALSTSDIANRLLRSGVKEPPASRSNSPQGSALFPAIGEETLKPVERKRSSGAILQTSYEIASSGDLSDADAIPPPRSAVGRDPRQHALALLEQAREHLNAGRIREAWTLAGEADSLDVPFDLADDRPELIRDEIRTLLQSHRSSPEVTASADSVRETSTPVLVGVMTGQMTSPHNAQIPPDEGPDREENVPERRLAPVSRAGRDASVPPSNAEPTKHRRAMKPSTQLPPPPPGSDTKPRLSFNFQQAPWDLVLRRFAQENALSLQMDTVPPGTLTYYDPREYHPEQVLDLLNGFLASRNFVLVKRDESLIVVDASKGIPQDIVPEVPLEEVGRRGRNEVFTVAIPVLHTSVQQAARDIKPFLGPLGNVVPLVHTNRLVLTDTGHNIRRIQRVLAFEPSEPHRPVSAVYPLQNTNAVDVAKAIMDFLSRLPNGPGAEARPDVSDPRGPVIPLDASVMVVAEARTNSLLVSAPPNRIEEIYRLICRLDRPPAEVVIQALLVEVELANTDEFGVEVGVQDSVLFDRSVVNNILTVTESIANPATGVVTSSQKIISQTANPGFNFNNQPLGNNVAIHPGKVGTQGLSTLGVGRVNGDLGYGGLVLSAGSESLNVLLRALSEKRKVDVLSRPQIRAIDNRPAEIQIGQQVPVVDGVAITAVGSANPVIRQDKAGIILTVTPHIRSDGQVVIDVMAEKSAFNLAKGAGVPIFTDATNGNVIEAPVKDITQARTAVSCLSGQTIVLGGMITKHLIDVQRKVPFLGDIPVLGHAFRYSLEQSSRRELLIFLTPQIIRDPLQDSEMIKNVEIARTHFPAGDALQIHGPVSAPPNHPSMPVDAGHALDESDPAQPGNFGLPPGFPEPHGPRQIEGDPLPPGPNFPVPPPPAEAGQVEPAGAFRNAPLTQDVPQDSRAVPPQSAPSSEKKRTWTAPFGKTTRPQQDTKNWIPWKKERGK